MLEAALSWTHFGDSTPAIPSPELARRGCEEAAGPWESEFSSLPDHVSCSWSCAMLAPAWQSLCSAACCESQQSPPTGPCLSFPRVL